MAASSVGRVGSAEVTSLVLRAEQCPLQFVVEESDFLVFHLFYYFKIAHFGQKVLAGDAPLCPTKHPLVTQDPSVPKNYESGKGKYGKLKTLHF